MRLALIAGATAALLASTAAAFAVVDTGTIREVEWGVGTITLDNGNTYIVPPALQAAADLNVGDKVKVTYEDMIASAIEKLPKGTATGTTSTN